MDETKGSREIEIWRVKYNRRRGKKDLVAVEMPLTIFFNDRELATLFCSPQDQKYLALGFLCAQGLVGGADSLDTVTYDHKRGLIHVKTKKADDPAEKIYEKKMITPDGSKGAVYFRGFNYLQGKTITSSLSISGETLLMLMHNLQERALLFKSTGGVHNAALADAGGILVYNEDIGRHNAIDKIVGECLLKGVSLQERILLSSGRISAEIIVKGARLGLPMIVSRSAPTSLAVELAGRAGITLVGFARGSRFNIYTHPKRIF